MNWIKSLEIYGETHHPKWLDILRFLLGGLLFVKAIFFLNHRESLMQMLETSNFSLPALIVLHYIIFAHLLGGLMIAIGLLTRLAIIVQIPILVGAVIFINAPQGLIAGKSELELSILVLFLLLFFLIYGSGPVSIDKWMQQHQFE